MWLSVLDNLWDKFVALLAVYIAYKGLKNNDQQSQGPSSIPKNKDTKNTKTSSKDTTNSTSKKTEITLKDAHYIIGIFICIYLGYSLYSNWSLIQHSAPLISGEERNILSNISFVILNSFQTIGLCIYITIILYSALFIFRYLFLRRPFHFLYTPLQILFCAVTIFLTWNMSQILLQVELGNLYIDSIQNVQDTASNDLLTTLSKMAPFLLVGQIALSIWFFINLMRNYHSNQEFLNFNLKHDAFQSFILLVLLSYVIITYHLPL